MTNNYTGIGSTTHKLARAITKILTSLLGSISSVYLKNSGDLLNKIENVDITNLWLV